MTDTQDKEWRCFHCDEVFTDRPAAFLHFGYDEGKLPACLVKGDIGLLQAWRDAEAQADEHLHVLHHENTETLRAYHALQHRSSKVTSTLEQNGYDKGVKEARDEQREVLNQMVGALQFVLAFYESGQTLLDTNAWKSACAGAVAAYLAGAKVIGWDYIPYRAHNGEVRRDDAPDVRYET